MEWGGGWRWEGGRKQDDHTCICGGVAGSEVWWFQSGDVQDACHVMGSCDGVIQRCMSWDGGHCYQCDMHACILTCPPGVITWCVCDSTSLFLAYTNSNGICRL